jgi:hypothetical protein
MCVVVRQELLAALLQKAFKCTSQDRAPPEASKKWGTIFVVNNLFRLYFRVRHDASWRSAHL